MVKDNWNAIRLNDILYYLALFSTCFTWGETLQKFIWARVNFLGPQMLDVLCPKTFVFSSCMNKSTSSVDIGASAAAGEVLVGSYADAIRSSEKYITLVTFFFHVWLPLNISQAVRSYSQQHEVFQLGSSIIYPHALVMTRHNFQKSLAPSRPVLYSLFFYTLSFIILFFSFDNC